MKRRTTPTGFTGDEIDAFHAEVDSIKRAHASLLYQHYIGEAEAVHLFYPESHARGSNFHGHSHWVRR